MNSKSAAKLAACASFALFLSGIPSQKACAQEQEKKVVVEDADNEKRYLPANSISVSSGYSWLSNEILTANGDKLGRTPTGFDVTMEYAHLWKLKNTRRPFYIGFSIAMSECECAWQIASPSASAASFCGSSARPRSVFTIRWICSFSARPLPQIALFIRRGSYS